jgi:hypothetical protein
VADDVNTSLLSINTHATTAPGRSISATADSNVACPLTAASSTTQGAATVRPFARRQPPVERPTTARDAPLRLRCSCGAIEAGFPGV